MQTLRKDDGSYLFPIFKADEYWKRIFNALKTDPYNSALDKLAPYIWADPNSREKITDEEELKRIRKLFQGNESGEKDDVTGLWGQQREMGTIVHGLLNQYIRYRNADPSISIDVAAKKLHDDAVSTPGNTARLESMHVISEN